MRKMADMKYNHFLLMGDFNWKNMVSNLDTLASSEWPLYY